MASNHYKPLGSVVIPEFEIDRSEEEKALEEFVIENVPIDKYVIMNQPTAPILADASLHSQFESLVIGVCNDKKAITYLDFLVESFHNSRYRNVKHNFSKPKLHLRDTGDPSEIHAVSVAEIGLEHGCHSTALFLHDVVEDTCHNLDSAFSMLNYVGDRFGTSTAINLMRLTNFYKPILNPMNERFKDSTPIGTKRLGSITKDLVRFLAQVSSKHGKNPYITEDIEKLRDFLNTKAADAYTSAVASAGYNPPCSYISFYDLVLRPKTYELYIDKVINGGMLTEKLCDRLHNTDTMGDRESGERPRISEQNLMVFDKIRPYLESHPDKQIKILAYRLFMFNLNQTYTQMARQSHDATKLKRRYTDVYTSTLARHGSWFIDKNVQALGAIGYQPVYLERELSLLQSGAHQRNR